MRLKGLIVPALLAVASVVWIFPAPGYWVFTANIGVILAVSTLGLLIVVGWAREVSLAHAGLTGTAVYVCAYCNRSDNGLGWPFLAAAGVGVGLVVLLSVLVALATARLSGVYIMVLTLVLQVTIERTVFYYPSLGGFGNSAGQIQRPSLLGVTLAGDRSFYLFSLATLAVVLIFLARLRACRYGRGMLLMGVDRQVASAVGVPPWRLKILAFALGGLCAGVAGALTAPLYLTPPTIVAYTSFISLFWLAIPVLAGFGSLCAVAGVAIVFALTPVALEHYRISPLTLGAAGLLLGTQLGPRGLSGLVSDQMWRWRRVRSGGRDPVDVRGVGDLARGIEVPGREGERQRALAVLQAYLPGRVDGDGDVLVASDISVAFGGVQALRRMSLVLPAGGFVGLIGPNGAGKTTLFDCITGLRTPDSGRISLGGPGGRDITGVRAWDRAALGLGRTFQASRLNLDASVAENLLSGAYTMIPGNLAASVLGLPRARAGARRAEAAARAVATLFDIDQYWDARVALLSFGNRRRVEIGRSLMSGPSLLLLDEPSAGLDPTAARLLFSLVNQLHRALGLTVLLVEHDVRAVLANCGRIYVVNGGQVVAVGTPDEVAAHPDVRSQYLGLDFDGARRR